MHATIHIGNRLVGLLVLGLCGITLRGITVVSHDQYQDTGSVVEHPTLTPHFDCIRGDGCLLLMNILFNACR